MTDLSSLNKEQREAVLDFDHNLLILACAGSGKTRTITSKIAYAIEQGIYKPYQILAVTFTNRAAAEMRGRVEAMLPDYDLSGLEMRTFHSFGAYLLRRYGTLAGLAPDFCIYDDSDSLSLLDTVSSLDKKSLREVVKAISKAKDRGLTPDSPGLDKLLPDYDFSTLFRKYEDALALSGNADFADLISKPTEILRDNSEVGEAVHNRFRMVLVDEYQDSNKMQFEFLQSLIGEHTQLVVVGDDDQSIYSFRGADISNILTFASSFKNVREIKLEKNYRSTSEILAAAGALISHNKERHQKNLVSAENIQGPKPAVMFSMSGKSEAERVANLIRNLGDYNNTAILYRTNAQSQAFEQAFTDNRIPYKVVGALRFYEREEVKDALSILRLLMNHRDAVSFRRIINKPARGLGEAKIEKIVSLNEDLFEAMKSFVESASGTLKSNAQVFLSAWQNAKERTNDDENLGDMMNKALEEFQIYDLYNREPDRTVRKTKMENLGQLVTVLSEAGCGRESLSRFLEKLTLDTTTLGDHDPRDEEGVTLMTMHNTKGLEFNRVFVVGMEDEIIPGRSVESTSETEEERRILYVAMTRARQNLYLSFAGNRSMWGRTEYHMPTRFFGEIPDDFLSGDKSYTKGRNPVHATDFIGGTISQRPRYTSSFENKPEWASSINIKGKSKSEAERPVRNEANTFSVGDKVRSANYGEGVIKAIETKSNGNRILVIDFKGRSAKFIEAFAVLEKL